MKQTTCAQIGGPATCTMVFKSGTAEDMIDQAWKHLQAEHPEQAANIMKNPKEENDKWMANFKTTVFPSLPDAA